MHRAFAGASAFPPAPPDLTELVAGMLAVCLDIRALWSLDHEPAETSVAAAPFTLLVFADAATLRRLCRYPQPRDGSVALFVVTDGDLFEAAWGHGLPGSLARWSWRQTSPGEAFYDQARWSATGGDDASVVRVRRKALLLWQASRDKRRGPRENGV